MAWNTVPDFGDAHAKTREWVNEASGAKMAEVLYDAHDHAGNLVDPDPDSTTDGHGRWVGIQIGDAYEMVVWQHPRKSGGKTDLGFGGREDAVRDLEADLAKKESLAKQAEAIVAGNDLGGASARAMQDLMDQWKKVHGWHTPREDELWERFNGARRAFYAGRDRARSEARQAKQALVEEAKAVLAEKDFRNGSSRMRDLMDRWKKVPSAGRDDDQKLWEQFNGARKEFFDLQHQNYVQRQERMGESLKAKQALVQRAREITEAKDYSRQATDAMRQLSVEWKAAGSAGHDHDEELWTQFRAAQQPFWDARKVDQERRHADWEKRHAAWCARMEGVVAGKERDVERIEDEIAYLEYRRGLNLRPDDLAAVERDLTAERDSLKRLRDEIADIRKQMEE